MNWDGYTIFSVLSGGVLLVCALGVPGLSAKDRFYGLLGAAFFIGYGLFVAHQTSGTFLFPIWIFIIPPAAVIYLVVATVQGRGASKPATAGSAQADRGSSQPTAAEAQSPMTSAAAPPAAKPVQAERPAVWAPPPPPPARASPPVQSVPRDPEKSPVKPNAGEST
jgi:hypothetical protein